MPNTILIDIFVAIIKNLNVITMEKIISVICADAQSQALLQEVSGRSNDYIKYLNMEDSGNGSFDESALTNKLKDSTLVIIVTSRCTEYSAKLAFYCKSSLKLLVLGVLPDVDAAKQFAQYADSATVIGNGADVELLAVMMQKVLSVTGQVNIEIGDMRAVLSNSGLFYYGYGIAEGKERCIDAVDIAVRDIDAKPRNIIAVVSSSQNCSFKICELTAMNSHLTEKFGNCDLIWGTNTDNTLDQKVGVFMLLGE